MVDWVMEDFAQPVGRLIITSGVGDQKKFHYEMFLFLGLQYQREDSVLLVPEKPNEKPYVAIIKDIYKVQWFYRPTDVETKYVGKWKAKDRREIFYSFHCAEVFAESVKGKCIVHFVPENMELPNRKDHRGFIVQKVYDDINKKLMKFSYKGFNKVQKNEIEILKAKTISRLGHIPDILKKPKTMISRRKRSNPQRFIPQNSIDEVTVFDDESIRKTTASLCIDRHKRINELLEAVKQASDIDFLWTNDVIHVVHAFEKASYDSFGDNIPKYNYKSDLLVQILKNSQLLVRRLLNGEIKVEQLTNMKHNEILHPPPKLFGIKVL